MDNIPRCIELGKKKIYVRNIHDCSLREALLWQKKEKRKF